MGNYSGSGPFALRRVRSARLEGGVQDQSVGLPIPQAPFETAAKAASSGRTAHYLKGYYFLKRCG
jgi:hypothetical protein